MTKVRQDGRAEDNLTRQGYEIYRPMARVPKVRKGKRTYLVESLFPRYLFIKLDVENDNWAPIRSTYGVSSLVRFGQTAPRIPDELIAFIKSNEQEFEKKAIDLADFKPNDPVLLADGPLKGYEAIFQSIDGAERALLLITIMGVQQKIRVPASYIC